MWCSHLQFQSIVENSFLHDIPLSEAITTFEAEIKILNKEVFGNIFNRKKHILARLAGIQKSPNYYHSLFLQDLESKLSKDFSETPQTRAGILETQIQNNLA